MPSPVLRVIILKPGKYDVDGYVQRFRRGFMPNSTVVYLASLTPPEIDGARIEVTTIDEYVYDDLDYLHLLSRDPNRRTLLAFAGVQSHQFHRALDLAAYAKSRGVENAIIGGPHPMTCDTSELHDRGVSFCLSEAESVWPDILRDALAGDLAPVYGGDARWVQKLDPPVLIPPSRRNLKRYAVRMLGIYPARGCPYKCNFCSVIKIAGRQIRSQSIETTIDSLRAAKAAGVRLVMFTSDNFNKYPEAVPLLTAMMEEKVNIPFFVQCDTQVARQEDLIELLSKAGCFQMFLGVESFNRQVLREAQKNHNHPEHYREIIRLCRAHGVSTHFSNIVGFPADTEEGINEQLDKLRALSPDIASFYILTPIPGTEQYDDFLQKGLITERNLDRYDGTCATWRHPHLTQQQLTDLLFHCYWKFYSFSYAVKRSIRRYFKVPNPLLEVLFTFGVPLFTRFCAIKRIHPMSGGVGRLRLDDVKDYLLLRKQLFGFNLVPLPASLELTASDKALNNMAKITP
ncbi:MAG TPA: radical SAM protein [Acidobacteriota bacterium]